MLPVFCQGSSQAGALLDPRSVGSGLLAHAINVLQARRLRANARASVLELCTMAMNLQTTNPTKPVKASWDSRSTAVSPSHDSHGRPCFRPRGFAHPAF